MDDIEVSELNVIKVEELKLEPDDHAEEQVWDYTVSQILSVKRSACQELRELCLIAGCRLLRREGRLRKIWRENCVQDIIDLPKVAFLNLEEFLTWPDIDDLLDSTSH